MEGYLPPPFSITQEPQGTPQRICIRRLPTILIPLPSRNKQLPLPTDRPLKAFPVFLSSSSPPPVSESHLQVQAAPKTPAQESMENTQAYSRSLRERRRVLVPCIEDPSLRIVDGRQGQRRERREQRREREWIPVPATAGTEAIHSPPSLSSQWPLVDDALAQRGLEQVGI